MQRLWGRSDSHEGGPFTWVEQSAARSKDALRSAGQAAWRAWSRRRLAQPLVERARHALGELHDRSWLGVRRRSFLLGADGAVRPFRAEVWPAYVTRTMLQHVGLGDFVVDVGASVGYHALLFARRVGGRGHVFAFEPEPLHFSMLKMNVAASGQPNLTLAPKAVHNANAVLHLHRADPQRSRYHLYAAPRDHTSVEVHAVRLDDFFGALDRPISLLRIDLGGGEYAALEGARSIARNHPKMKLVVHCAAASLRAYGATFEGLLDLIAELGFRPFAVDTQARQVVPVSRGDGLGSLSDPDRDLPTHLLCLR